MNRRSPSPLVLSSMLVSTLGLAACSDAPRGAEPQNVVDQSEPTVCAAVRGNGPRITAHFASLARVTELVGPLDGIAGGSSGSVTSFLTESIAMNEIVRSCGPKKACSASEVRARTALLFKSLFGYVQALGEGEELSAAGTLGHVAGRVSDAGIPALLETDPAAGVDALVTLLSSDDLRDLINPEVLELLATSPDPAYHARDLVDTLSAGLTFEATDPRVLVRPGVLDFAAFGRKLGRVGTFYAGWAPVDVDAYASWLDDCADASRGMTWAELSSLKTPAGTCGDRFAGLVADYRATLLDDEASYPSRIDEPIGEASRAIVGTAVLVDGAAEAWHQARAAYLSAEPLVLDVDFDDVRFAYWASAADASAIEADLSGYEDAKTAKRLVLPPATWAEALSYSPAEPGLARGLELPSGVVSVGGWSDLAPVEVLADAGCDSVIYVTRRVPEESGRFEVQVAALLGMDADDEAALFDYDVAASATNLALERAGAVWCTDWDAPKTTDLVAMESVGYDAPAELHDELFDPSEHPGTSTDLSIRGCSPL